MSIEKALQKYIDVVKSDGFVEYEKKFADRIISALSKGYIRGLHETLLVKDIVNSVSDFEKVSHQPYFKLFTKSIFIHGQKSLVQFNYYGKRTNSIELGDLIFIISIVYNKRKYFEKVTINQFKKDKSKSRSIVWNITNNKQLYLLSRFPAFIGVKGLVPKRNCYLPNYSGCLGSYGLLHKPGNFVFVSATRLDSFMGDKKTLKRKELYDLVNARIRHLIHWHNFLYPAGRYIFNNCHFSNDVFNFVHEYLRMNIGELVSTKIGMDNPQARNFIDELKSIIESKAKKEKSKGQDRFNERVDIGFEDGGIGIIHTTIDLIE